MAGFEVTLYGRICSDHRGDTCRLQLHPFSRELERCSGDCSSVIRVRADSQRTRKQFFSVSPPRQESPKTWTRLFQQESGFELELEQSNEGIATRESGSGDLATTQEPLRTIALCSQTLIDASVARALPRTPASSKRSSPAQAVSEDLLAYTKATKHLEGRPTSIDPVRLLASTLDLRALLRQPMPP